MAVYKGFTIPVAQDAADAPKAFTDFTDSGPIPRFGSTASRDAAIPSPVKGMVCFVAGTIYFHNGTIWWHNSIRCHVRVLTTAVPITADATWTTLKWNNYAINDGSYSTSTGAWTAPHTGTVEATCNIIMTLATANGSQLAARFLAAGEDYRIGGVDVSSRNQAHSASFLIPITQGQTVIAQTYVSGAAGITKNVIGQSQMTIRYVSA